MADATIKAKLTADATQLLKELEASKSAFEGLRRENDRLIKALGASASQLSATKSSLNGINSAGGALRGQFNDILKGAGGLVTGFVSLQAAGEAVNRTISSTQATGDAFAIVMEGAKGAVDHFFQSLASGDWSSLFSGMQQAIALAEDYARAMDSAGDARDALGYMQARTGADIAKAKAMLEDPDASKEKKNNALKIIANAKNELRQATKHARDAFRAEAEAMFRKATGYGDLSESEFLEYSTGYGVGQDHMFNAYDAKVRALEQRAAAVGTSTSYTAYGAVTVTSKTRDAKIAEEELRVFKEQNKELEKKRQILNKLTDEERASVKDRFIEAYNAETALASAELTENRSKRKLLRQNVSEQSKAKREEIHPKGTIARAEQDLKKLQESLSKATTEPIRKKLRSEISELQAIITEMKTGRKTGHLLYLSKMYDEAGKGKIQRSNKPAGLDGVDSLAPKSMWDHDKYGFTTKLNLSVIKNPFKDYLSGVEEAQRRNDELYSSLGSIGGAFGSLGDAIGGSAGNMLKWGGMALQTIAQILPQIALITSAQSKMMLTGAGAHASLGGPLAIAGAVASVAALFSSLPQFERGGVIGGSSYYGDKILARVNSGEMIANQDQQRRIWQMMQQGRAEMQANVQIGGEFRLRGADLLAVVDRAARRRDR